MTGWMTFYTITVSQGVFLSVVLRATGKSNRTANRILSVLVPLLTSYLLDIPP